MSKYYFTDIISDINDDYVTDVVNLIHTSTIKTHQKKRVLLSLSIASVVLCLVMGIVINFIVYSLNSHNTIIGAKESDIELGEKSKAFVRSKDVIIQITENNYSSISLVNASGDTILIGDNVRIQTFIDGEWYEIITRFLNPLVGIKINPGEKIDITTGIKEKFVSPSGAYLPTGHYRLIYPYKDWKGIDAYGNAIISEEKYAITEFDVP